MNIDWNLLASSEAARGISIVLAILSAFFHAGFGALQKSKDDPILTRAAIDIWFLIFALPFALFVFPLPTSDEWLLLLALIPIHTIYKLTLAMAYRNGDFTVIYPIARGSSPIFSGLVAGWVFSEYLNGTQWLGVLLISSMILLLAFEAARRSTSTKAELKRAIGFAIATGFTIMVYSIYDTYAIRQHQSPFTFLAWFFVLEGFSLPLISYFWRNQLQPKTSYNHLAKMGFIAAPMGIMSFAAVFIAVRIGHVGEVIALRETSVIFAAIFGLIFLGEKVTWQRLIIIIGIGIGAVLIEVGGG